MYFLTIIILILLLALLQSRPELHDLISPIGCTKPHLADLCTLLAPIAPKYLAIGTALKVPMDTLGLQYSPDTHQDNLRRTLKYWLDNGNKPGINYSPVTWGSIISVIEVQNFELAQRMRLHLQRRLLFPTCSGLQLLFYRIKK